MHGAPSIRTASVIVAVIMLGASTARSQLAYDSAPEGLVGNGSSVVKVRPDGYAFHTGGDAVGTFRLVIDGTAYGLADAPAYSTFFPGGVVYTVEVGGAQVEVLHGALPGVPYVAAFKVTTRADAAAIAVESSGAPAAATASPLAIPLVQGHGEAVFAAGAPAPGLTWHALRDTLEAPYRSGLILDTPSDLIDRGVPFCRALLDLGFDGRLHVCEIFRWRDVWSRDLGSGLVPGAMASGRFDAARRTIAYDLARHAAADPRGLKVTLDPSQGGTAEGVAWLTRAVWRDYLLTGDREALRRAADILRPWVEAWIDRDHDQRGTLIDVSEWMDHSRFFLFPDGARVLYSNVLFAKLLRDFAGIERELAAEPAAARLDAISDRFVQGINASLWDPTLGAYDNLTLWGRPDARVGAAENALAVLCGVASQDRAERALATVRAANWRAAGSATITPPMAHVPLSNDHNFHVWPWWNAVEARARARIGDDAGVVQLLAWCSATLADGRYPGAMEELLTPDGVSEGGPAFLTGAGAYLDAVVEGLLGVEILAPGCARLRVAPCVPASWRDWRAEVPLPQGAIHLAARRGKLRVTVTDPRVLVVEVPAGTRVIGARAMALTPRTWPASADTPAPPIAPIPAPRPRLAAVLVSEVTPLPVPAELPQTRLTCDALPTLDPGRVGALIIPGNALPRRTADGVDVPRELARYLDAGGALVFYGATMLERGTMGEQGGVIEWHERRPVLQSRPIERWTWRAADDTTWTAIAVPATWESQLGREYDGRAVYRASFRLPAEARGRTVVLDLGRIDDDDSTFVNGVFVGARTNWQTIRHYRLQPAESAYGALVFGAENMVVVRVIDTGGGGGLYSDVPRIGVQTDDVAWAPVDPRDGEVSPQPVRFGVVSWGPGGAFFNSWETSRGVFGFKIAGRGVTFAGSLANLPPLDVDVAEAFTDFAVSRPWRFEPLAYTHTDRHLLVPDQGERYPCAARLVNTRTGAEFILLPASLTRTSAGAAALRSLGLTD